MTTIRHMYEICDTCTAVINDTAVDSVFCRDHYQGNDDCPGTLQPVIFVSDLKKMLQERIQYIQSKKTFKVIDRPASRAKRIVIDELESILSEIDPTENEKEE